MTGHTTAPEPSRPRASREPELLRASRLEDLLAAVPSMIGMHPEQSIVVVPFLGTRAGGGFRIPLPGRLRRVEIEELARGCVRVMESMPRATAALAVVYTSESYGKSNGIPLLDLGRAVLRRLERTTLGIVGVACVGSDGWGRYTIPEETRAPRPLSEIDGSETGLLARAATPEPIDVVALAELPAVEEIDRRAVEASLRRGGGVAVGEIVPLVERWLAGPPSVKQDARMIRLLQAPAVRDQVTVQIALGSGASEEARRRQERLEAIQAFTGESMDEIVGRDMAAEEEDPHDLLAAALLMGTGPGPDRDRVERAATELARAVALAPDAARPPVLTVLAWCWWSRGVSSVAATHLEAALRIDPGYSMARLYSTVFAARRIPDWVIDAASRSLVSAAARS